MGGHDCRVDFANALGVSGREATLAWVGSALSIGLSVGSIVLLGILRRTSGARIIGDYGNRLVRVLPVLAVTGVAAWFGVPWIQGMTSGGIVGAFVAAACGGLGVLVPVVFVMRHDLRGKGLM